MPQHASLPVDVLGEPLNVKSSTVNPCLACKNDAPQSNSRVGDFLHTSTHPHQLIRLTYAPPSLTTTTTITTAVTSGRQFRCNTDHARTLAHHWMTQGSSGSTTTGPSPLHLDRMITHGSRSEKASRHGGTPASKGALICSSLTMQRIILCMSLLDHSHHCILHLLFGSLHTHKLPPP